MFSTIKSTLSLVVAVAIVGWTCGVPCYATNLIQNGNFETSTVGVLGQSNTVNVGTPRRPVGKNYTRQSDAPVIGYLTGNGWSSLYAEDGSYFMCVGPTNDPSRAISRRPSR